MFQIKTKADAKKFLELLEEGELFIVGKLTSYLSEKVALDIRREEEKVEMNISIKGEKKYGGIEWIEIDSELIHKMRKDVNIAIRDNSTNSHYNKIFTENENPPRVRRRTKEPEEKKTSVRLTEEEIEIIKESRIERKEKKLLDQEMELITREKEIIEKRKEREREKIEEKIEPRPLSMLKNILYKEWLKEEKEHYRTSGVAAYAKIAYEEVRNDVERKI